MKRTIALLLLGAAIAAPVFAADKDKKKDKSCVAVVVGSPQQLGSFGSNKAEREFGNNFTTFSATKVMDVEFAIVFAPSVAAQFTNAHIVEFRVYTPAGNLYQSISIPVTTDARKAGERHRVPGYPDLIPVQVLESLKHIGNRSFFAKVTLPVAGTPIVHNSLYGKWRAVAYVEDELVACGTPASFTITQ